MEVETGPTLDADVLPFLTQTIYLLITTQFPVWPVIKNLYKQDKQIQTCGLFCYPASSQPGFRRRWASVSKEVRVNLAPMKINEKNGSDNMGRLPVLNLPFALVWHTE